MNLKSGVVMDTPSLTAFLAAGPGFSSSVFIPTAAHDSSSRYWAKKHGALLHPRPLSRARLCTMQDFSSSAYWNKFYSGGDDVSAKEAVTEWHVNGEALIAPLERLLGSPSASEELAILNVGCGTSTLWARYEGLRGEDSDAIPSCDKQFIIRVPLIDVHSVTVRV